MPPIWCAWLSVRPGDLGRTVSVGFTRRGGTRQKSGEEKFRLAVEACPNGMVMIDSDGKMVMVNTEVEQQFGYRRNELIGQSIDMLFPVGLRGPHANHSRAVGGSLEARRLGVGPDLAGLRKDGSEFSCEVGLTPIRTSKGPLVLGVVVDVSERRHTERLKDEFVSTVSHELRTPLTSIAGSLGLLVGQWGDKLPESATPDCLVIAHKNSQRLVRLINDILDIEKIESGRVVFIWGGSTCTRWSSRRSREIGDLPRATAFEFASMSPRRMAR